MYRNKASSNLCNLIFTDESPPEARWALIITIMLWILVDSAQGRQACWYISYVSQLVPKQFGEGWFPHLTLGEVLHKASSLHPIKQEESCP